MTKDLYLEDSSVSDDFDGIGRYLNYKDYLENNTPTLTVSIDLRDINFYASQLYELGN